MDIQLYKEMANNNAPLPEIYQATKIALITCTQIDECKAWADKALALGSYAKQACDESLERLAKQIRATAMRRCGELLGEYNGQGKRTDLELTAASGSKLTQREVAEHAGLSERQQVTAVRIANVPDEIFFELVESDTPPTTTELAELGKKTNGIVKYETDSEIKLFPYQQKFIDAVLDLIDSNEDFHFMKITKSGKSVTLDALNKILHKYATVSYTTVTIPIDIDEKYLTIIRDGFKTII